MTAPRCIRPGATWLVTRRTTRRHFLLRPDADRQSQNLYWYTTAVVAKKFGIEIHAVQVLSTHIHEVLTDVRGKLPAFLRERNRLLANALKCLRGWPEEVFQRAPASCVELFGVEAIASKIAYTLANCVEAGLVRDPVQWPGVTVPVNDIGRSVIEVERPSMYFDAASGRWPDRASLAITMPRPIQRVYGGRAQEVLSRVVKAAVEAARAAARLANRVVGPVGKLMSVPFMKRSRSWEEFGAREPTFATGGNKVEARNAREERRSFHQSYRAAFQQLQAGLRSVEFPFGAWRWTTELACCVAPP